MVVTKWGEKKRKKKGGDPSFFFPSSRENDAKRAALRTPLTFLPTAPPFPFSFPPPLVVDFDPPPPRAAFSLSPTPPLFSLAPSPPCRVPTTTDGRTPKMRGPPSPSRRVCFKSRRRREDDREESRVPAPPLPSPSSFSVALLSPDALRCVSKSVMSPFPSFFFCSKTGDRRGVGWGRGDVSGQKGVCVCLCVSDAFGPPSSL